MVHEKDRDAAVERDVRHVNRLELVEVLAAHLDLLHPCPAQRNARGHGRHGARGRSTDHEEDDRVRE